VEEVKKAALDKLNNGLTTDTDNKLNSNNPYTTVIRDAITAGIDNTNHLIDIAIIYNTTCNNMKEAKKQRIIQNISEAINTYNIYKNSDVFSLIIELYSDDIDHDHLGDSDNLILEAWQNTLDDLQKMTFT
jgi:hypothetical protein